MSAGRKVIWTLRHPAATDLMACFSTRVTASFQRSLTETNSRT
jgi:hypothetical protein